MPSLGDQVQYLYPNAIPLVDWAVADNGSGPFISKWDEAKLGLLPTQAQLDAVTDAEISARAIVNLRNAAKGLLTAQDPTSKEIRAFVMAVLDAFNRHSRQFRDLLAVIDASATLAQIKSGAAAISSVEPARTAQDLMDAISNKIDAD